MTTSEHLQRIKAKCEQLLELAAKRTPGKWDSFQRNKEIGTNYCRITFTDRNSDSLHGYCGDNNAAFIASCAGPAEAGWRATIAAIAGLQTVAAQVPIMGSVDDYRAGQMHMSDALKSHAEAAIKSILAAWPEELL